MPRGIVDEFTGATRVGCSSILVSSQRRMQLRWLRDNRCKQCGQPAAPSRRAQSGFSDFCLKHLVANREYQRKYSNRQRRNRGAYSYLLEGEQ